MTQVAAAAEFTLRSQIDSYRAEGRPLDIPHAIGLIVPLAVEIADQHREGYSFYLYPSALFLGEDGLYHASARSASPPTDPRDVVCLPPESQGVAPGQSRASVYGIAAILYELITLQSVGPQMRPPSELVPGVPPELELVLSKALVTDPAHRPDDLNALAQALYQINNTYTQAPPPADVSHLDHAEDFDVDVSLSLLPSAPVHAVPAARAPVDAPAPPGVFPTTEPVSSARGQSGSPPSGARRLSGSAEELHAVKARLEADPMPRYVVVKDGMDHGPFRAVELLQQIASHTFEEEDVVRDEVQGTRSTIAESPDFAPFARHARLHRVEKAEKAAIEQAVVQESRSTRSKTVIGLVAVGALLVIAGSWFLSSRGAKNDEILVVADTSANVESEAGLQVPQKKKTGGQRITGTAGGFPQLAGGLSCEAAQGAYVEEMKMGAVGQPDLTAGQFQAILGNGAYLNACGVPSDMGVKVCAAIQNGRAVGVTVSTTPSNPGIAGCISGQVRAMSFPSHPKLDVTRTSF